MKKLLFFLPLSLVSFVALKCTSEKTNAQQEVVTKSGRYCNYITDDTLKLYRSYWKTWCASNNFSKVLNSFVLSGPDLKLLCSRAKNLSSIDYVEGFFAFDSQKDTSIAKLRVDFNDKSGSLKADTTNWAKWSKKYISKKEGRRPVGVKIMQPDLNSIDSLMTKSHPVLFTVHFIFHSKSDMDSNRVALVFCPVFDHHSPKIPNSEIGCKNVDKKNRVTGTSSINIDFTNPCPPCSNIIYGH